MSWIKNLVTLIFSIGISVFVLDYSIQKLFPEWFISSSASGNQYRFYQYDSVLGWTNLKNVKGLYSRKEFSYEVATNSHSVRDEEFRPSSDKDLDILALGDSYVWGIGAAYGERFTEVLETKPQINEVRNYGVSGYGQLQQYLQLTNTPEILNGVDVVVLTICLANDILDNIHPRRYGYLKPYASIGDDGELKIFPVSSGITGNFGSEVGAQNDISSLIGIRIFISKLKYKITSRLYNRELDDNSELDYVHLYSHANELQNDVRLEREKAYLVLEKLLLEIKSEVESNGAKFLVALAPTKYELGLRYSSSKNEVRSTLVGMLNSNNVDYVDPTDLFGEKDFWSIDGHWKSSGHLLLADRIYKKLQSLYISD